MNRASETRLVGPDEVDVGSYQTWGGSRETEAQSSTQAEGGGARTQPGQVPCPVITFLGIYSNKLKTSVYTETSTQMFIAALSITAKTWKPPG